MRAWLRARAACCERLNFSLRHRVLDAPRLCGAAELGEPGRLRIGRAVILRTDEAGPLHGYLCLLARSLEADGGAGRLPRRRLGLKLEWVRRGSVCACVSVVCVRVCGRECV